MKECLFLVLNQISVPNSCYPGDSSMKFTLKSKRRPNKSLRSNETTFISNHD